MRRWLLVLGFAVVALGVAIALAARNLDAYLNENKDLIAEQVETVLKRGVSFGAVGVSFAGGLGVRVEDLQIADDPAFSAGNFLRADAIDVRVKIWPALFGSIEVAHAILRAPSIAVIQNSKGLSTDSLGGAADPQPSGEPGEPLALVVALVDIRDGTLRFRDETARPAVEIEVAQIEFEASDVSLDEPVAFDFAAAVLGSPKQNASAKGTIGPIAAESPRADLEVRLDPLVLDDAMQLAFVAEALPPDLSVSGPIRLELNLAGTLTQLEFDTRIDARGALVRKGASFEKAQGAPLSLSMRGALRGSELTIETGDLVVDETTLHFQATAKDLANPRLDFTLTSDALALASFGAAEPDASAPEVVRDLELVGNASLAKSGPAATAKLRSPTGLVRGVDYQNLVVDVRLAGRRVAVENMRVEAFGGELTSAGTYDATNEKQPSFDFDTRLADVRIEKLIGSRSALASQFITGNLSADLDLNGMGSEWEQIKRALTGIGNLQLVDGEIRNFNPAGQTLQAINQLPMFASSGVKRFLDQHSEILGVGDTPFEALEGKIDIRDGWVHVRGLELATRGYTLTGSGRYSLDNEIDATTVITLSNPLSQDLIASEKRLSYLRKADGRVAIPLAIKGSMPKVAVLPDLNQIAQSATQEAVTGALQRALGVPPRDEAPADDAQPEADRAPPANDLGSELIRKGLGGLLSGGED